MRTLPLAATLVAIIAIVYALFLHIGILETQKVRYVRSQHLLYEFEGMKEAQAKFGNRDSGRRARVDTLKKDLREGYQVYMKELPSLDESDRSQWENRLASQENNLIKFAGMVEQDSKADEEEILGTVLEQVNDFVYDYAVSQGYDVVLGTTSEGSILYGNPELDITDEILLALNKQYRGE